MLFMSLYVDRPFAGGSFTVYICDLCLRM